MTDHKVHTSLDLFGLALVCAWVGCEADISEFQRVRVNGEEVKGKRPT